MKALVFGGGSMKGAYQVGAAKAVLESGFEPDMIYGISVGALNATYLVHEAGRQMKENKEINWRKVARHLMELWITRIDSPQAVGTLRSRVSLGVNTLMSQFEGLLDPSPLHDLIREQIDKDVLAGSPVKCKIGAVNIDTGEMRYVMPSDEYFLNYLFASSAIPLIMPPVSIGEAGELFMDGALREVVPVRQAIEDGATEIIVIACHAGNMYQRENFSARNLISLIQRIKDITVNQLVNSNLTWAVGYAERASLRGEHVTVKVIRPHDPPALDLTKFTSEDISRLIVQGYQEALGFLKTQSSE